jgi:ubiquinone/menaquinone biosynthesis C-methylase UbiE
MRFARGLIRATISNSMGELHVERSITDTVNEYYQNFMSGIERLSFDKIGFFNLGYWKGVDDSVELAQLNLIETLARFFTNRDGSILDVACGKGASSKFMTKYFDPKNITGINISERQLEVCRLIAPECTFQLMDATRMQFEPASYDNVLCIEGALHFMTRYKFLEEAHRVLKPGGRLAMSDLLFDYDVIETIMTESLGSGGLTPQQRIFIDAHPKENYLPNLDAYRENLFKIGFRYFRVEDITEHYELGFRNYEIRRVEREFEKKRDYKLLEQAMRTTRTPEFCFAGCFVYAIK